MNDDKNKLVCLTVADANTNTNTNTNTSVCDGSIHDNCGVCKELVWVSKFGQEMLQRNSVDIVCNRCAEGMIDKATTKDPIKMEVRPEMLDELFEQILKDSEKDGCKPKKLYDLVHTIFVEWAGKKQK